MTKLRFILIWGFVYIFLIYTGYMMIIGLISLAYLGIVLGDFVFAEKREIAVMDLTNKLPYPLTIFLILALLVLVYWGIAGGFLYLLHTFNASQIVPIVGYGGMNLALSILMAIPFTVVVIFLFKTDK
jgi:hypothetical protein